MEEKPIALQHIGACRRSLAEVESALHHARETGDLDRLQEAVSTHHDALADAEKAYLEKREWSAEPDFVALTSGGEDKPPQEPKP